MSLTKSHDGPVRIGDALDFELIASNAGLSVARDVVVTDPVPDALTVTGASGTGWTCDVAGQLVTCTLDAPLAPNTSAAPITISTVVTAADYPSVTNTAHVSTSAHDPNPVNNFATDRVLVPPLVDLAISKTHTGVLQVGSDATYTLSVVNLGPTNDPNPISVVDTLPAGLTYVSATGVGWTCSANGQTVLCRLPAGMDVGAATPITLVVHVGSPAYPSVTNTASVSSASEDTDPTNNSASDPAEVLPLVQLGLTKTVVSFIDNTATYRLVVTNHGPQSTVSPIVVTDDLPAGLAFVSASGPGWSCAAAGSLVTCTYPAALAVNESAAFTLVATVTAAPGATIVNTATASGGGDSRGAEVLGETAEASLVVPAASGGVLPHTGAGVASTMLLAIVMLSLGVAMTLATRRRRTR